MEFDSIKQHRHFCPWIASTGNGAPGWKQTLLALQRQEGCSPSSASIIKVFLKPTSTVLVNFYAIHAQMFECMLSFMCFYTCILGSFMVVKLFSEGNNHLACDHLQVDDPITSIRNLFMSPSPKRMKPTVLTSRSPQQ